MICFYRIYPRDGDDASVIIIRFIQKSISIPDFYSFDRSKGNNSESIQFSWCYIEFLGGKRWNIAAHRQMEELPPVRSLTNRYANHELRERNARGIWIIDKLELRVPKSCLHTYKLAYYRLFTAITIINNYINK